MFQLLRHSSDSLKPLLKQLNWLPIIYRIKYKLSLITHKIIHHNSPDYVPDYNSSPFLYTHYYQQDHQTSSSLTPHFLLDTHSISPSNVILKYTTFLKLSHHKSIWTNDCLGIIVVLKLLKVKVTNYRKMCFI